MLLFKSKFNLQSINILKSDQESDSDSKLELKVNQNSIEEVIFIQNQIIIEN